MHGRLFSWNSLKLYLLSGRLQLVPISIDCLANRAIFHLMNLTDSMKRNHSQPFSDCCSCWFYSKEIFDCQTSILVVLHYQLAMERNLWKWMALHHVEALFAHFYKQSHVVGNVAGKSKNTLCRIHIAGIEKSILSIFPLAHLA